MPNIAAALRSEISRVARKEIRTQNEVLNRASRSYRSDIAALKRRVHELESLVKRLSKDVGASTQSTTQATGTTASRFSAKGLASNRQRLGLSAAAFGKLLGASANTVHNWESGAVRPSNSFFPAIAALRGMGKKEAKRRLIVPGGAKE